MADVDPPDARRSDSILQWSTQFGAARQNSKAGPDVRRNPDDPQRQVPEPVRDCCNRR